MTTDRPDDRADEQIEAACNEAVKVIVRVEVEHQGSSPCADKVAYALRDAGLLSTPADTAALAAAHRKGFYEGADSIIREELSTPADQDNAAEVAPAVDVGWRAPLSGGYSGHSTRGELKERPPLPPRSPSVVTPATPVVHDDHSGCRSAIDHYVEALGIERELRATAAAEVARLRAIKTAKDRAEAERDHAQEVAELAEKDRRSAHFDAARALAERDLLRAQVAAVRALHQPHVCTGYPDCTILFGGQCAHDGHCNLCRRVWPCETIQKLDAAGGSSS